MGNPVTAGYAITKSLTFSVPTDAQDDNDVIAATQEIEDVFLRPGAMVQLDSLVLLDEGDQAAETDIFFLSSNVAMGTEDSAISITDANARKIVGALNIPAANYFDLIGSQVAVVRNIGMKMQGESTSLFVALVTRGTPTYGAADALKAKLSFTAYS